MICDLILKNANIIALDSSLSKYSWVAVDKGKIIALGNANDMLNGREVIDLKGKTVLPGLMDCHVHVLITGLQLGAVDLLNVKTLQEALDLIEEACKETPGDGWIYGVNFVPQSIEENRYPNRWELDEISQGHKVIVFAATLHGCSVNSAGIEVCNVPEDMPGVEKAKGEVTGLYMADESAFTAMSNLLGSMPDDILWGYIEDCVNNAVTYGVTTMHGLFGQMVKNDRDMSLIHKNKEKLPITMVEYYQTWNIEDVRAFDLPRIGGCLTLDGALFEYTMANYEPYDSAPALRGVLYHNDLEVYELMSKAHAADMQITFHALGERAIDQLLYTYYRVIKEQGFKDLRHRIEHFCLPTEKQIKMATDLGLILSMQPGYTYYWDRAEGGEFAFALGRERANRWDPFHKLVEAGAMICVSSDAPVATINPLRDIASLVNNPNPIRNIGVTDALKMCTINGAYAACLEKTKGSIEIGKDADLVVINMDPYEHYDKPEIHNMEVEMTIREGRIIYQK